ncbi:MAG: BON domain-containing protein [Chloroflexi bacterium]|nr:BON domain-containing protein [Chloroflexota bacterium]
MALEERLPDEQIAAYVRDTLAWDTRLDATHVEVTVDDGKVTLTGLVRQASEKLAASEDAWRIKGVRAVHNRIAVSPLSARTEADISADVVNALRGDPRVDDKGIVVSVAGGVVTLSGVVASQSERRAAIDDAWHTVGVVDVVDQLAVSPQRRRPDTEIAADVRAALSRDARITDATRISARVHNGVVRLYGGVDRPAERQAAEEDARFTAGVVEVLNELAIAA